MKGPGRRILHYQLEGKLGAGGMGVVYRAFDTRLRRTVALKFLPNALVGKSAARARLLAEAQAAARLDHPNIGTVYAVEEGESGELFIAMALYEGKTLENRLIPLPPSEALRIGAEIAQGLAHAHGAGVVHRDIKPGNVLLTRAGETKLLDFGLAQLSDHEALSSSGSTLGTLEYASPEQVRGRPTDHRTDLWSLGVMLYEMLTGVSPFRGPGGLAATSLRVLQTEPAPPSTLQPGLPAGTDGVLARALAKPLAARYSSAQALWEDLRALAQNLEQGAAAKAPLARGADTQSPPVFSLGTLPIAQPATPTAAPTGTPLSPAHNLPYPTTPLVGRPDELALLDLYLGDPDCRLVTLLGVGGTGKTRLSLQVAHDHLTPDRAAHAGAGGRLSGVYFVPLEALSAPEHIVTGLAAALALPLQAGDEPLAQTLRAIGEQPMLVVLDNFEHLLEGAGVLSKLLQGCPNLKLLVTSRVRLGLPEEWVLPLQGLPYPKEDTPLAEAAHFGAVQLFAQRARRVQPSFSLEAELAHVAKLCRLLRGLPLGLELASAWTRVMRPAEIVQETLHNLDFLETRSRFVPERHRSIRAVFEHSWALLSGDAQRTLAALSVFRSGFQGAAARAVAAAPLALLAELVDSSLLQVRADRYEWHPLLQGYAREKLAAQPDEAARVRAAHGAYYLGVLQEQGQRVRGAGQPAALEAIERELENIRAAWSWAVETVQAEPLGAAAEPLRVFFEQRGRLDEGLELLTRATGALAAAPSPSAALGLLQVNQAYFHFRRGDVERTVEGARQGVALLRPLQESRGVMLGLNALGAAAGSTGDYAGASAHFEEALALAEATGADALRATYLGNLAALEEGAGHYERAQRLYRESLALSRSLGDEAQEVTTLNNLGSLLLSLGRLPEAKARLEKGLALARQGQLERLVPFFLANLGQVAYKSGHHGEAFSRYEEALRTAKARGEGWLERSLIAELGRTATARADLTRAERLLKESLQHAWTAQDAPLVGRALVYLAELREKQGQRGQAATLLHLALRSQRAEQEDRHLAEALLQGLEAKLPRSALAEASAAAQRADLEEVVQQLLDDL